MTRAAKRERKRKICAIIDHNWLLLFCSSIGWLRETREPTIKSKMYLIPFNLNLFLKFKCILVRLTIVLCCDAFAFALAIRVLSCQSALKTNLRRTHGLNPFVCCETFFAADAAVAGNFFSLFSLFLTVRRCVPRWFIMGDVVVFNVHLLVDFAFAFMCEGEYAMCILRILAVAEDPNGASRTHRAMTMGKAWWINFQFDLAKLECTQCVSVHSVCSGTPSHKLKEGNE